MRNIAFAGPAEPLRRSYGNTTPAIGWFAGGLGSSRNEVFCLKQMKDEFWELTHSAPGGYDGIRRSEELGSNGVNAWFLRRIFKASFACVLFCIFVFARSASARTPAQSEIGDTCRLAVPVIEGGTLWRSKGGPAADLRCPLFRHAQSFAVGAVRSLVQPALYCGTKRLCGKTMAQIRIGREQYVADPGEWRIVERAGELADVPAVASPPAEIPCSGLVVGENRTTAFLLKEDRGAGSSVEGLRPLEPGTVVGGCRRYGGFVMGFVDGRPALVFPDDMVGTCIRRPLSHYLKPGPSCREFVWNGTSVLGSWLYPADPNMPRRLDEILPAEVPVTVQSVYAGRSGSSSWCLVDVSGSHVLVPTDALRMDGTVELRWPVSRMDDCRASAEMVRTICDSHGRVLGRLATAPAGALPPTLVVPAGVEVPILQRADGVVRLIYLGLEVEIAESACLPPTGRTVTVRQDLIQEHRQAAEGSCVTANEIAFLPDGLEADWKKAVSDDVWALLGLLKAGQTPNELLVNRRYLFPLQTVTAADLAVLGHFGASPAMLRAAVAGPESAKSPLEIELHETYKQWAMISASKSPVGKAGGAAQCGVSGVARTPEKEGSSFPIGDRPAREAQETPSLRGLREVGLLLQEGMTALAREQFLDILAAPHPDPAVLPAALQGYREAARQSDWSPRAVDALGALCLPDISRSQNGELAPCLEAICPAAERTLLLPEERGLACRMAAAAALDRDDSAAAARYLQALSEQGPSDARQQALSATFEVATGHVARASVTFAQALRSALSACGVTSPLVDKLQLQLARAALEAGEPEAARQVLGHMSDDGVAQNLPLAVRTLVQSGHLDEAIGLLEHFHWGMQGGMIDAEVLLWSAHVFSRLCLFEQAEQTELRLKASIDLLSEATNALHPLVEGPQPDADPLLAAVDAALDRLPRHIAQMARHELKFECEHPCAEWLALRREQKTLKELNDQWQSPPIEGAGVRLTALLTQQDQRCATAVRDRIQAFEEKVSWLRSAAPELDVDRLNRSEGEYELAIRLRDWAVSTAETQWRQDLGRFRAGAFDDWPALAHGSPLPFRPSKESLAVLTGAESRRKDDAAVTAKPCRLFDDDGQAANEPIGQSPCAGMAAPIERALTCLVTAAEEGPIGIVNASDDTGPYLLRYLPILRLVRSYHLSPKILKALPPTVGTALQIQAQTNEAAGHSCCLAVHPELIRILSTR